MAATRARSLPVTATAECCPTVLEAPLDAREAAELAHAFAALGDPARLRLLGLIAAAEGAEACVCDLVAPVGKSQPTVSHHLKVLADAGLIVGDKRGRWVWYSIVPGRLDQLRSALVTP
jgi:ArsR family transcriptional regulator